MDIKMKNKKNLKIGILVLVFLAVIGIGLVLNNHFKEKGVEGKKEIEVEVILTDGSSNSHKIKTDQEFLRGALEEQDLIEGTESDYGLFVMTVDGVTANDENQEWWAFSKDGESLLTGVDETPIHDGDHFEITLTVGY
jgi:uncharacterized protein DUF4430